MSDESDLDVLIRTGLTSPIVISLAEGMLEEARIPFFAMGQNPAARQDCVPSGSRGSRDSSERRRNQVGPVTGPRAQYLISLTLTTVPSAGKRRPKKISSPLNCRPGFHTPFS